MDWEREKAVSFRLGKEEGEQQKAVETAKNAISLGLSADKVHKITGLSLEQIEKIILETGNQQ